MLSRKSLTQAEFEALLASLAERGSAYLPQVNAFYIREFKMIHAAEDAARFLHQACQGLPQWRKKESDQLSQEGTAARSNRDGKIALDDFYARVIEHAVAYFGSRVLCPSRPAPEDSSLISRAAVEKAAQAALHAGQLSLNPLRWNWAIALEIRSTKLISPAKSHPVACAASSSLISTSLGWPAKSALL